MHNNKPANKSKIPWKIHSCYIGRQKCKGIVFFIGSEASYNFAALHLVQV